MPKSEAEKVHEAFVNYKNEILCFAKRSEVPFSNNLDYADIGIAYGSYCFVILLELIETKAPDIALAVFVCTGISKTKSSAGDHF